MIRLYDRFETEFDHNETILADVISAKVTVAGNGNFELELEYPRNEFAKTLTTGKVLKVPTSQGDQLFRIYKPVKNLTRYKIYAKHIFYDLAKNFLKDVRPTNTTGAGALNHILSNTQYPHPFTGISDIPNTGTAYYIRKNPVEALLGANNAFVKVWGGELVRDNFRIRLNTENEEPSGVEISLGRNLTGIEVDTDETDVVTRLMPTAVGANNVVIELPEEYLDSAILDRYESPRVAEMRIELTEEQQAWLIEDIYQLMRDKCFEQFDAGLDMPKVNIKVDFIELSKTDQYKDYQQLEKLNLYDLVDVNVEKLGITMQAKVIKTTFDSLKGRYEKVELGSFMPTTATQTQAQIVQVEKKIESMENKIRQEFKEAQDKITGNRGGFIVYRLNAEGKPYEQLVMDTEDIQTAKNVIRLNQQGIGFSQDGYNGPFGVAITIDGTVNAELLNVIHLNAASIDNGVLSTILIESKDKKSYWNLDTGEMQLQGGKILGLNMEHDLGAGISSYTDPTTGEKTFFQNGRIGFELQGAIHFWESNREGITLLPDPTNTGNDAHAKLWVKSPVYSMVDFGIGSDQGYGGRIALREDVLEAFTKDGGDFRFTHGADPTKDRTWSLRNGLKGVFQFGKSRAVLNGYDETQLPGLAAMNIDGEYARMMANTLELYNTQGTMKATVKNLGGGDIRLEHSDTSKVWDFHQGLSGSLVYGVTKAVWNGHNTNDAARLSIYNAVDNSYGYVSAADFNVSSERELKTNIQPLEQGLSLLATIPLYNYEKSGQQEMGTITDEAPEQILGEGGTTISLYSLSSLTLKSVQELSALFYQRETTLERQEGRIAAIENRMKEVFPDE